MEQIVFALPGNEILGKGISKKRNVETGRTEMRYFPDGETYVRVLSDLKGKEAILAATLNNPPIKNCFRCIFFRSC